MNGYDFRDNEKPVNNDTYGTVSTNFTIHTINLHCKNLVTKFGGFRTSTELSVTIHQLEDYVMFDCVDRENSYNNAR